MRAPKTNETPIATVQWLRGLAAMMVVAHHARNPVSWLYNPLEHYQAFGWGVDIFFVISGFIMFVAAREEAPVSFIQRRIIRVVPLYWLATLALLAITARRHHFQMSGEEWSVVLQSLLFVPHFSLTHPGEIWPFLVPGWTLNYEMLFYALFFIGLLAKKPLVLVTAMMLAMVAAGVVQHPSSAEPIWVTYTDPLLLEFVAGLWIGKAYVGGNLRKWMAVGVPLGLLGLMVALPALDPVHLTLSKIIRLVCSAMVLAGAVAAARSVPDIPLLEALGNASYSIYLSHTVIGLPIALALAKRLPLEGWPQFLVYFAAALVICAAIGYAIHVAVEKPLIRLLRNGLSKRTGPGCLPRHNVGSTTHEGSEMPTVKRIQFSCRLHRSAACQRLPAHAASRDLQGVDRAFCRRLVLPGDLATRPDDPVHVAVGRWPGVRDCRTPSQRVHVHSGHLGYISNGVEDTQSEAVRDWAPAYENYTFTATPAGTRLVIDQDAAQAYEAYLCEAWPRALQRLKALCETASGA